MKNKGFTLVELSIVLVIIGLLISGLLVGQSMIKATKIQSFTKQMQQFDIGVSTFKTTYGQLPGDTTIYNPGTDADNNGYIQPRDTHKPLAGYNGEISALWVHLGSFGLANESGADFIFTTGGAATIDVHYPRAKIGEQNGVFGYGVVGDKNYWMIQNNTAQDSATLDDGQNGLAVSDALAVDAKIDDGVANTGTIRAAEGVGFNDVTITAGATACVNPTAAAYNIANAQEIYCQLRIEMLSSAGGD